MCPSMFSFFTIAFKTENRSYILLVLLHNKLLIIFFDTFLFLSLEGRACTMHICQIPVVYLFSCFLVTLLMQ